MARTRKNTVDPQSISLDWAGIEATLTSGGRVSLSHLAQTHKVFPIDLRKIFEARFGDRIVFKRGRSGGVYWKSSVAQAAATAPTSDVSDASPTVAEAHMEAAAA